MCKCLLLLLCLSEIFCDLNVISIHSVDTANISITFQSNIFSVTYTVTPLKWFNKYLTRNLYCIMGAINYMRDISHS